MTTRIQASSLVKPVTEQEVYNSDLPWATAFERFDLALLSQQLNPEHPSLMIAPLQPGAIYAATGSSQSYCSSFSAGNLHKELVHLLLTATNTQERSSEVTLFCGALSTAHPELIFGAHFCQAILKSLQQIKIKEGMSSDVLFPFYIGLMRGFEVGADAGYLLLQIDGDDT